MDPDLLAEYARGGDCDYGYEPSYDLDIVGEGVDIHLQGNGLNPEGDYYDRYDDDAIGTYYIDCFLSERKAHFSVHIDPGDGERVYLFQGNHLEAGVPHEADADAVIAGKPIHLKTRFYLHIDVTK